MGRRKFITNVATDMLRGSCVTHGVILRRQNETPDGHQLEGVEFCPTDKGTTHYSRMVVDITYGEERVYKSHKEDKNGTRALFMDGMWVEYYGSDEGWQKLKKGW